MMSAASDALRVLADPLRYRIVEMLSREQLCTCHIVEQTGAGQTNVSNHLRVLGDAGLVEAEPAGRFTYYWLRPNSLEDLSEHLAALGEAARATRDARRPACQ